MESSRTITLEISEQKAKELIMHILNVPIIRKEFADEVPNRLLNTSTLVLSISNFNGSGWAAVLAKTEIS